MSEALLEVRNLRTCFHMEEGSIAAVDGVNFHVIPGEAVGLVGESGCGKSVTALSVMRLISPPGEIEEGEVFFKGELWTAVAERGRVKPGEEVVINKVDGLTLYVTKKPKKAKGK